MKKVFRYAQPGNVPVVAYGSRGIFTVVQGHCWPGSTVGPEVGPIEFRDDGTRMWSGSGIPVDIYLTVDPVNEVTDLTAARKALEDAGYTVTEPPMNTDEALELLVQQSLLATVVQQSLLVATVGAAPSYREGVRSHLRPQVRRLEFVQQYLNAIRSNPSHTILQETEND